MDPSLPGMRELKKAQELAYAAGQLALKLQANLHVTQKPLGHGPVSNGDLAADKLISEGLLQSFPDDLIVSEESFVGPIAPPHERLWFVDPIDGTSSYIVGRSDFVVMIGLVLKGIPALGVIYQPATDTMWSGINLTEKFCQRRQQGRISQVVAAKKPQSLELRLMASRTSRSKKQALLIEYLSPAQVLYQSSVGLKAMMVLDGKADLYVCWSHHVKMWDTCAPAAIMAAAGAHMEHIDGKPLKYEGSIAHGHALYAAMKALNRERLDALLKIDQHKLELP